MRKTILLIIGLVIAISAFSQDYNDVVYLKNGSVIKGEIIKNEPGSDIIIRTEDGQLFSFNRLQIEQVLKKLNQNLDEYGGGFSYGISIGGGGLVGVPIRFNSSEKFAFEMALHYRPGILTIEDSWGHSSSNFEQSIVFSLGPNFYFNKRFKDKAQKVKLNGITLKGGAGTGGFDTYFVGAGWIHESFKKFNYNKSFNLELGPGFLFSDYNNSGDSYSASSIIIYWKFQWNWFKNYE